METKQQADERTGTPLNGVQAETTSQRGSVDKHSERENNDDSELENTGFGTSSKGEETIISSKSEASDNPLSMKKKLNEWVKTNPLTTLIITVIAGLMIIMIQKAVIHFRCYSKPYITLESDYLQVFRLSEEVPGLEYSVGESKWRSLGTQNIVFGGKHGQLLLRGQSNIGTGDANITFATEAQVICTGDICTLIDYKNYNHADTKEANFIMLFKGCTQLVVAPDLTPKVLSNRCYMFMFWGCTSLKTAPELPATELAACCYTGMFMGCSSLITAPELPATELAKSCYALMFSDCTSLEKTNILPATELAAQCYYHMFSGCSSLKRAPKLPGTGLARDCYDSMFLNCTSLEIVPELPATELAESCYYDMFKGCTSLHNIRTMAIDINASDCLTGWLENTSPIGTFYKNKNAKWSNDGIVPPGWKVVLVDP